MEWRREEGRTGKLEIGDGRGGERGLEGLEGPPKQMVGGRRRGREDVGDGGDEPPAGSRRRRRSWGGAPATTHNLPLARGRAWAAQLGKRRGATRVHSEWSSRSSRASRKARVSPWGTKPLREPPRTAMNWFSERQKERAGTENRGAKAAATRVSLPSLAQRANSDSLFMRSAAMRSVEQVTTFQATEEAVTSGPTTWSSGNASSQFGRRRGRGRR